MSAVKQWAESLGIPVHLDGARVFNAAVALGVSLATITQHVTTVQFCLSKVRVSVAGSALSVLKHQHCYMSL